MDLNKSGKHWTEAESDAFAHRLAFDFIAQIEKQMEKLPMSQIDLAQRLNVSEGAVSKLLNNPQNLTLRTIAKYSRALGMKAAVIAYDDGDSENAFGPINSEVFTGCWERAGKPRDSWDLNAGFPRAMDFGTRSNAVGASGASAAGAGEGAWPRSSPPRLAGDAQSDLIRRMIQTVPSGISGTPLSNADIFGRSPRITRIEEFKKPVERYHTRRSRVYA